MTDTGSTGVGFTSRLGAAMAGRRLELGRFDPVYRRAARTGVAATALAGLAVVGVGSGRMTAGEDVVTAIGNGLSLRPWAVFVTMAGVTIAAVLLVAGRPDRHWVTITLAAAALFLATAVIAGPPGVLLRAAGVGSVAAVVALLAAVTAVGVAAAGLGMRRQPSERSWTTAWWSAAPFVLLTCAYGAALAAPGPVGGAEFAMSGILTTVFISLGGGLLLVGVWQAVEGLNASVDGVDASGRRLRGPRWIPVAVIVKMVLLVAATFVLEGEAWERFRTGGPVSWAYALIVAVGVLNWARSGYPRLDVTRRGLVFGGAVALGLFLFPWLAADLLVGSGFLLVFLVPTRVADVVAVAVSAAVATVVWRLRHGAAIPGRMLTVGAGVAALVYAVSGRVTIPFEGIESIVVEAVSALAGPLVESQLVFGVGLVAAAVLVSGYWLISRHRLAGMAVAAAAVGVWTLPRAVTAIVEEFSGRSIIIAPNAVTLDAAMTVVLGAAILWPLIWRRRIAEDSETLILMLGVVTAVTFVPELGGPLLDLAARGIVDVTVQDEGNLLGLALALILPAAYGYLLGAKELNRERNPGPVLASVGLSCLLLTLALIALAIGDADSPQRRLTSTLILPGLTLAALLGIAMRTRAYRTLTEDEQADTRD